jgi:hypothetical protein
MRPDVLGRAGKAFIRSCLIETGAYRDITQKGGAGRITDARGKNAVDLYATHRDSGIRYAISVKSQAEWLFSGARAIKDSFVKARAHGREPWIIVPFLTDEARADVRRTRTERSR